MGDFLKLLNLFDWAALIILLFFCIQGYVKGFLKQAVGIVGLILSVALAKLVAMPLTLKLYEIFGVREKLLHKITVSIQEVFTTEMAKSTDQLNQGLEKVLGKFGFISNLVLDSVKNDTTVKHALKTEGAKFTDTLANAVLTSIEPIIQYILSIIVFLVLAIILRIILSFILRQLVDIIASLPLVGVVNSVVGCGFGILQGVCVVILVFSVLFVTLNVFPGLFGLDIDTLLSSKAFSYMSMFKEMLK